MFESLLPLAPGLIALFLVVFILRKMRVYASSGIFFSNRNDILNQPKERLVEIGGLAVFPIAMIALCLSLGLSRWLLYYGIIRVQLGITGDRILQVLVGCAFLFIIGLKNDIHGTFGWTRFLFLLLAVSLFPISGLWIRDFQGILGIHALSPWIGIPLTLFLSLFLIEMVALLDDVNAFGMSLLSLFFAVFLGVSLAIHFVLGLLVASCCLGITLPYALFKRFLPSWRKTFVGKAGSYVLGYLLAYLSLAILAPAGLTLPSGSLILVFSLLFLPAFDLVRTLGARVRENRSFYEPDRNLLPYRLQRLGFPEPLAFLSVFLLLSAFATLGILWFFLALSPSLLLLIDILLYALLQVSISWGIRHREEQSDHLRWEMTYGPEAWEAEKPEETIRRKREHFGNMGLPDKFILGDETDFIPDGMSSSERVLKRTFDAIFAALLILLFSPLFLLCWMAIRLQDHGPAIYAQERIGRFGKPFMIYKFRSMRLDAEAQGPALSHAGGDDDPRLTPVGRFLRAHHLDELPQLWNVLRGDMSFIGYRPERQFFISQIIQHDPRYTMLYQIRPGVTSYATLYNGYTDTMEKMLRRLTYDLYYLEHRSFFFDMQILWHTFLSILFGKKF